MTYTKENLKKWLAMGSAEEITGEEEKAEGVRLFLCYWGTLVTTSEEMEILEIE